MPNVKGKKFPYTKEGIKASKEYAESDARERSQKYKFGGTVLPIIDSITKGLSNSPSPFGGQRGQGLPPSRYKKGGKVKK